MLLQQSTIDQLVDKFYDNLTNDLNFSSLFTERSVDIEKLKDRQRAFLFRLANVNTPEDNQNHVKQVQERHSFRMSPERSIIWFNIMTKTMDEMDLPPELKENLLTRIKFLMNTMLERQS